MGFFLGNLGRIRRLAFILGDGAAFIAIQVGQDVEQGLGPEDGQFIEEGPRRFLGIQGNSRFFQHLPRIHAFVEKHDGHAAFGFAVFDGVLDGGGAAILRQQRAVDVEAAVFRDVQDSFRQNLTVSDDDDDVRRQAAELFDDVVTAHGIRLEDGDAQFQGLFLDRRESHLLAASPLFIGLAVDGSDIIAGLGQFFQGRDGKVRRPHEYDT